MHVVAAVVDTRKMRRGPLHLAAFIARRLITVLARWKIRPHCSNQGEESHEKDSIYYI